MANFPNPDEFSNQIIQLKSPEGSAAKISCYGAHVLSWMTPDGREHLFLSPKTEYRAGAAIRGGDQLRFCRAAPKQAGGIGVAVVCPCTVDH